MKNDEYEKLGVFYLGRNHDPATQETGAGLVLYKSKDLTTHAVCLGMTGSGKTGLCLSILEEAAIDGIPVIAIDPKGDIGNLLLTFPQLRGEDFVPWVDPDEAARQELPLDQFAEKTAETWREGLETWNQDGTRIQRLRDAADLAIYTPGSSAGLPLTVFRSFNAPPPALLEQQEAYRERVASAASGLLALLGIDADLVSSREHILLANLLDQSWRAGRDMDLAALIHAVQSPPFDKVGVIDLEAFFPAKERFALALKLNNLIASPGFAAWMEGERLDVGSLLYTREGKPRVSILSIAHLSDSERMFFVTILLNEVVAWIRTQPGTSSLRALLYMDEIFGYFPPSRNPPSKTPMLTLLKQARAFGLGVVLATQNPVDLNYKGLSNAGTWFLGRLQTKRDKERVLEGLEGASNAAGHSFDRATMDRLLSGLGNRIFLMNNVHEDEPTVFETRWALSYLRGPLTREQIQTLMAPRKQTLTMDKTASAQVRSPGAGSIPTATQPAAPPAATPASRPVVPPDVPEFFIPRKGKFDAGATLEYRPALLGVARLHYIDKKCGVDHWETLGLLEPIGEEMPADVWDDGERFTDHVPELDKTPEPGASFAPLPAEMTRARCYAEWTKALKNYLYREQKLTIWHSAQLKTYSRPEESERDFRVRLVQGSRELRDQALEELRAKYAPKRDKLQERVRKAREKLDREQTEASKSKWDAAISFSNSVLGAFLGKKTISQANVGRASSAARAAGRVMRQSTDVGQAEAELDEALREFTDLELEFKQEVDKLGEMLRPEALPLEKIELTPRKADIAIERVALAWTPWVTNAEGAMQKAY
ncbi:MAG: helicase HerA domain-containing protein [Isosphaeraceae bacterium]